jgi:peptidoglycan hydrolase-like protein with peptidoglycan-binding domain
MKARAYDHPEVVRLRKRIQSLEAHGLPYDHPRIEAIRSRIRALQIDSFGSYPQAEAKNRQTNSLLQTAIQLMIELPKEFRPLTEPVYQEASVGEWRIIKRPYGKNIRQRKRCVGYWSNDSVVKSRYSWTLFKEERVWMSLTPMELESQGYHARLAHGRVVVAGLGMGAVVSTLLTNPRVSHITVIEQDAHVIELLKKSAVWFTESPRLEIENMNALDYVPAITPDTFIADIWPMLGADEAVTQMKLMQANIEAKTIGWWGQEIDLVTHLKNKGYYPPITVEHVKEFEQFMGVPLIGASHPRYKDMVLAAVLTLSGVVLSKSAAKGDREAQFALNQIDALNALGGMLL